MRKTIELPSETIKSLKIMAIENDQSFKSFLENILIEYFYENQRMSDLIAEDGQDERAIWNYLLRTYKELRGTGKYSGVVDFMDYVSDVARRASAFYMLEEVDLEKLDLE